jgi:hypothetical protein
MITQLYIPGGRTLHRLKMFQNSVLKRFFVLQGSGEETGGWRKLRKEKPNIVRIIKSRRILWTIHHAHKRRETYINFWWEYLKNGTMWNTLA